MLSQIKYALVCCVGLLYGCGGFILSVLSAVFAPIISLFFDRASHQSPVPEPIHLVSQPQPLPARRMSSSSRRSTATSVASSEAPQTPAAVSSEHAIVGSPSESSQPSSPSRDYFSTLSRYGSKASSVLPRRRRRSLGEASLSQPSSVDTLEPEYHSADECTTPSGLKTRERASSVPRSQSNHEKTTSTQLRSHRAFPVSTASSAFSLVKGASVKGASLLSSPKALCPKPIKRKTIRKVTSPPLPGLHVWPASTVKKKRSQPLPTLPSEAPHSHIKLFSPPSRSHTGSMR